MRFSTILNLGLIAAGGAASVRTLRRRHAWERSNQRAYIVLDYDDALAVSTRAGLPLAEFLHQAHHHGATHMALPELTLNRLMAKGRLAVVAPAVPLRPSHGPDGWAYLASADAGLLAELARELAARVPGSAAQLLPEAEAPTLALKGDLPALAEMGLGFEASAAAEAVTAGLG